MSINLTFWTFLRIAFKRLRFVWQLSIVFIWLTIKLTLISPLRDHFHTHSCVILNDECELCHLYEQLRRRGQQGNRSNKMWPSIPQKLSRWMEKCVRNHLDLKISFDNVCVTVRSKQLVRNAVQSTQSEHLRNSSWILFHKMTNSTAINFSTSCRIAGWRLQFYKRTKINWQWRSFRWCKSWRSLGNKFVS